MVEILAMFLSTSSGGNTDHVLEYFWCSLDRHDVVHVGGTRRSIASNHGHALQCAGKVKSLKDLEAVTFALPRHYAVT